MSNVPINAEYRLRAESVTYRYPQNNHGLEQTTLALRPGELILVTGPSGCGKSTLARCLTGLIPHLYHGDLEGEVWLGALRSVDTPLWQLTERAGMVFQNPAAQMLAVSVEEEIVFGLENLGLAPEAVRKRLEATLARFGLMALRDRVPQTLSGGEQQKVALAAMIARQPDILVLDEPLSMLDVTAATELVAYLQDLAREGTTVVVCEHRAEYLADIPELRTLVLDGDAVSVNISDAESPPSVMQPPPFQLKAEHLGVRLGGRAILRDLSFSAQGGEVVAVVGRNGVGKTTLLRALAGLQKHKGRVSILSEQTKHATGDARPDFGLVFQNADLQLFNASVRDEILYRISEPDMAWYAYLLQVLGLTRYESVPPLLLSEGEKKRVALATVLMRRPEHGVLLDEPALGQDTVHKSMLVRMARGLAEQGYLVMMTTHDLTLAAQADRLLLLGVEGWVADGPPSQVLRDPEPWARIGLAVPSWLSLPADEGGEL